VLGQRYQIARLQSDFYRDQFRRLVHWLIMELLVMVLLVTLIVYQAFFQPAQVYYANTEEGRVLPMVGVEVQPS